MKPTTVAMAASLVTFAFALQAQAAPTGVQKCQAGKTLAAGKYAACRLKAEKKRILTGDTGKYVLAIGQCATKLSDKWQVLEDKAADAGAVCPDDPLSEIVFQAVVDAAADNIATGLSGVDLLLPPAPLLQTGETTCHNTAGGLVACAGSGQDGELQRGVPRDYVDNGDGTITDTRTGLTWEKKSRDLSVHEVGNPLTWDMALSSFTATLNAGSGFAGHTDWRLPNRFELESLLDLGRSDPAINPIFNSGCVADCTVTTCSCTFSGEYWTSTSYEPFPTEAWCVDFEDGSVVNTAKFDLGCLARAVRGP